MDSPTCFINSCLLSCEFVCALFELSSSSSFVGSFFGILLRFFIFLRGFPASTILSVFFFFLLFFLLLLWLLFFLAAQSCVEENDDVDGRDNGPGSDDDNIGEILTPLVDWEGLWDIHACDSIQQQQPIRINRKWTWWWWDHGYLDNEQGMIGMGGCSMVPYGTEINSFDGAMVQAEERWCHASLLVIQWVGILNVFDCNFDFWTQKWLPACDCDQNEISWHGVHRGWNYSEIINSIVELLPNSLWFLDAAKS